VNVSPNRDLVLESDATGINKILMMC